MNDRARPSGFTLLELLVVVAILAVLAGLLFPVLASAKRSARQAACASNMKQTATAIVLYCNDYDDRLHPTAVFQFDWREAHRRYLASYEILRCPGDVRPMDLLCSGGPRTYFDCYGSSYLLSYSSDTLDSLYEGNRMWPLLNDPMNAHRAAPFAVEPPELWRSNLAFPDTSVKYLHPNSVATN